MPTSLESSRTVMKESAVNNRASTRLSTYSMAPTLTPSIAPSHLSCSSDHTTTSLTPSEKANPLAQEVHDFTNGLARLDQPKLQSQRYAVSETKKEEISKLALGAKLERALGRRMVGQDASFTVRSEKKRTHQKHIPIVVRGSMGMGEKEIAA